MTDELVARLRAAGCVFAEDEAAILLQTTDDPVELERLVTRRTDGVPLEHVVGWAAFCGVRIAVATGVFVPRRRSEFLARRAAEHHGSVVVDLCCGTGAVGLVAAGGWAAELHAVDSDPLATACAAGNLAGYDVHLGDLFEPLPRRLRGGVDVIVAVTPYVPTGDLPFLHREARLYEPESTHDGGPDGLGLTGRVFAGAGDWLAPGGVVLVEVSAAQAAAAAALANRHGLRATIESDEDLDATIVVAGVNVGP